MVQFERLTGAWLQTNINSKFSGQKYTAVNSQQQEIRILSYAVAVQLPPQQQSRQDHSFYVVPYQCCHRLLFKIHSNFVKHENFHNALCF